MKFKYAVPDKFLSKVRTMKEFANGGMQLTVRLRDGREFPEVLVSDGTYFVAARGFDPKEQGGWKFWDDWK